ncbi:hypothetical protein ACHWQZ_G002348 [Mnemiopsis leidyi]
MGFEELSCDLTFKFLGSLVSWDYFCFVLTMSLCGSHALSVFFLAVLVSVSNGGILDDISRLLENDNDDGGHWCTYPAPTQGETGFVRSIRVNRCADSDGTQACHRIKRTKLDTSREIKQCCPGWTGDNCLEVLRGPNWSSKAESRANVQKDTTSCLTDGEIKVDGCRRCECEDRQWNCDDTSCNGVCQVFGGNVLTYDGLHYEKMSDCVQVLTQDCSEEKKFRVSITESRDVEVHYAGHHVTLSRDRVDVDMETVTLPHSIHEIVIQRVGFFTFVTSPDISLRWDGSSSLHVHADSQFRERLCGLCGDFNGDSDDEFTDKFGDQTDLVSFQKSWSQGNCTEPVDCGTEKASQECKAIKLFAEHCPDPEDHYHRACSKSVCSGDAPCSVLAAFFSNCGRESGVDVNWREGSLCSVKCPGNTEYSSCGSSCPVSCANYHHHDDCQLECVEGCFCPHGTVPDDHVDGACVPAAQCTCKHEGAVYPAGASRNQNCEQCYCVAGRWECNKIPGCGSSCSVGGFGHYQTLDHTLFDFYGECEYVLLSNCDHGDPLDPNLGQSFKVLTQRNTDCEDASSCGRKLKIAIAEQLYTIIGVSEVSSVGGRVSRQDIPYYNRYLAVEKSSSLVVTISLYNNVKISWDGSHHIQISVPETLQSSVCGLCGSYNGRSSDDFVSTHSALATSLSEFTNSWKTDANCESRDLGRKPCDGLEEQLNWARESCRAIREGEVFQKCHNRVDPEQFYEMCLQDMCSCPKPMTHAKCRCEALEVYAKQCEAQGSPIWWRSAANCKVECPIPGEVYQEAGSPCQVSCSDLRSGISPRCDNTATVEGCNCPPGLVRDGEGSCVEKSQCKCQLDGVEYSQGETVNKPCSQCVCEEGKFACSPAQCDVLGVEGAGSRKCHYRDEMYPEGSVISQQCKTCTCDGRDWVCDNENCPASCFVSGDPHYRTFDGKFVDFQGSCRYLAARLLPSSNTTFTVEVESEPCGSSGVTCTKGVYITLGGKRGEDTVILRSLETVNINGVEAAIPYRSERYGYTIAIIGFQLFLITPFGIDVSWDGLTRVYVTSDPIWMNQFEGMCGNFNLDPSDDMRTYEGEITTSQIDFGNSWKMSEQCPEVTTESVTHPCQVHPLRAPFASTQCDLLKSHLFEECHGVVDVERYYDNCYYDVCGCDLGGDCTCLCDAIATYAKECSDNGVIIDWRATTRECDLCCKPPFIYDPCGPVCPDNTCTNSTCALPGDRCVEQCRCPDHLFLNGDKCEESCDKEHTTTTPYTSTSFTSQVTRTPVTVTPSVSPTSVISTTTPSTTPAVTTTTSPSTTPAVTTTTSPSTTPAVTTTTTPHVTTPDSHEHCSCPQGQRIVELPIKKSTYYTNDVKDHSGEDFLYVGKTEGFNDRYRALVQFDLGSVPADSVESLCLQVPIVGTKRSEIAEFRGERMVEREVSIYAVRREWDSATVNENYPWSKTMGDDIKLDRFPTKNVMFKFTREDYLNVPIIKTVYLSGDYAKLLDYGLMMKANNENSPGHLLEIAKKGKKNAYFIIYQYTIINNFFNINLYSIINQYNLFIIKCSYIHPEHHHIIRDFFLDIHIFINKFYLNILIINSTNSNSNTINIKHFDIDYFTIIDQYTIININATNSNSYAIINQYFIFYQYPVINKFNINPYSTINQYFFINFNPFIQQHLIINQFPVVHYNIIIKHYYIIYQYFIIKQFFNINFYSIINQYDLIII